MRNRIALVIVALAALVLMAPAARASDPDPSLRTISVHVTVNGLLETDTGVLAWPTGVDPSQTPPSYFAFADENGNATISVDSGTSYFVLVAAEGFTQFAGIGGVGVTPQSTVPAGTTPINGGGNLSLNGTTFHGHVSRTGFSSFAPRSAGVGACPNPPLDPPTRLDGYCTGLRFAWANSNGDYTLRLPPHYSVRLVPDAQPTPTTTTTWNMAGFLFIDGRPVAPAATPTPITPDSVKVDLFGQDFSSDLPTPPAATVPSGTPDHPITVAASGGTLLLNVATVTTPSTPVPPDITFANGIQSFTAKLPVGTTNAVVRLTFDQVIPDNAQWYKLRNGVWTPYANVVHDPNDAKTLIITIADGSPGDDDGHIDGYVTDPGALGTPPAPANKDQCKNAGWKNGPYRNQGECVSRFAR